MLTAAQAAERAGIKRGTWVSYVSRGHAPPPDTRDPGGGNPFWYEATVDEWASRRPGAGARTDLTKPRQGHEERDGQG